MPPVESNKVILRSTLFSQFYLLQFGMSTRHGGVSEPPFGMNLSFHVGDNEKHVQQNRERFFGSLDITLDHLAIPQQVHSDHVQVAGTSGVYENCDALISNSPYTYLVVSVADCLPIFIFDPVTSSIAAVHSGWRGSKAHILNKAIHGLGSVYGAKPENMVAYIGPAAGVCCYEVGDEVVKEFDARYVIQQHGKKPHLDLKTLNKVILRDAGIKEEHIEISEYCTICHSELFHSYRRDKDKSGRMMGVIGIISKR